MGPTQSPSLWPETEVTAASTLAGFGAGAGAAAGAGAGGGAGTASSFLQPANATMASANTQERANMCFLPVGVDPKKVRSIAADT